jgi:AsmA protein
MGGLLKKTLLVLLGLVAVLVIATILLSFLIDPNNYRDRIQEAVKRETGRDLVIGEIDRSYFPTLALKVGESTLGNAPGFGEQPFLSFNEARLSLRIMPLIRGKGVEIGDVVLDQFRLNLAVAEDGRNNWQDMQDHEASDDADGSEQGDSGEDAASRGDATLKIAGIDISDAAVTYRDAQTGESYSLTGFDLETGEVAAEQPVEISSSFSFDVQPAGLAGDFAVETTLMPVEDGFTLGETEISALGIDATLVGLDQAESFHLQVDAFSLKSLMTRLNIEPPVTADPDALGKILFAGNVRLGESSVAVSEIELVIDDTSFTGDVSVGGGEAGGLDINLAADAIDLGRYMEPASDESQGGGETIPVEIPVELIQALNVRGNLKVGSALLSGLKFENAELGLTAVDGNLRMHPISADFFDGEYAGDVRIDASGDIPELSVNENVRGVSLGSLAKAMFDQENISGTINGSFKLGGRGANLAEIQRDLDGTISMELVDGALEGTDIWYELRKARAMLRQEEPPEPTLPARTEFSNARIAGPVSDGIFRNDELFAELPFMQLSGNGTVNLPTTAVDYRVTARFLDKPEFASTATADEVKDFTKAEIPIRISGTLAEPKVAPDIEGYLTKEAQKKIEKELKDRVLDKLFKRDD